MRLPISLILLGGAVLLAVLAMIPIVNIFVMMFGGLFVMGILFTVSMAVMAFEAATERMPWVFLILPGMYFGAYGVTFVTAEKEYNALTERAEQLASLSIPYDPETGPPIAVFTKNSYNLNFKAHQFVKRFGVKVAYQVGEETTALRLVPSAACSAVNEFRDASTREAGLSKSAADDYTDTSRKRRRNVEGVCLLGEREALPAKVVRVAELRVRERPKRDSLVDAAAAANLDYTTVEYNGRSVELISGWINLPTRFPMLIVGCNPMSNKFECDVGFLRFRSEYIGGQYGDPTVAIGRVLGLKQKTPDELRAMVSGVAATGVQARIDETLQAEIAASRAALRAAMANPKVRPDWTKLMVLADRPALVDAEADALGAAIRKAFAERDPATHEARRIFMNLLAKASDPVFTRVAGTLIGPLQEYGSGASDEFLARLGNLGTRAQPLLEHNVTVGERPAEGALRGLCRIGKPAAGAAPKILAAMTKRKPWDEHVEAAYPALLRMGRADLAPQIIPAGEKTTRYEKMDVTPELPPEACEPRYFTNRAIRARARAASAN